MMTARQRGYRPRQDRTGQPLAEVDCTRCGLRFASAAATHTRCPDCGTWVRVRRGPRPAAPRRQNTIPARPGRKPLVQQPETRPVQQAASSLPPVLLPAAPQPAPADPLGWAANSDDETYMTDRGRLVLAEWDTAGQLVPATRLPASYLATELPARGWYLRPHGQGICQVIRVWPAVAEHPAAEEPCIRPAEHGELCAKCFAALRTPAT